MIAVEKFFGSLCLIIDSKIIYLLLISVLSQSSFKMLLSSNDPNLMDLKCY